MKIPLFYRCSTVTGATGQEKWTHNTQKRLKWGMTDQLRDGRTDRQSVKMADILLQEKTDLKMLRTNVWNVWKLSGEFSYSWPPVYLNVISKRIEIGQPARSYKELQNGYGCCFVIFMACCLNVYHWQTSRSFLIANTFLYTLPCWSVCLSVGRSHFWITSGFCIAASVQRSATGLPYIRPFFLFIVKVYWGSADFSAEPVTLSVHLLFHLSANTFLQTKMTVKDNHAMAMVNVLIDTWIIPANAILDLSGKTVKEVRSSAWDLGF